MIRPLSTQSAPSRHTRWLITAAALLVAACQRNASRNCQLMRWRFIRRSLTSPCRSAAHLPGQVRRLGGEITYLTPRRPAITSANDCELRGGDYSQFDRAEYETALQVWLQEASSGDPRAQTFVGEIYARGLGIEPDYTIARQWYRKAATQNFPRAQVQLGLLYEKGLGVEQDRLAALNWYRKAAGVRKLALAGDGKTDASEQASFESVPAGMPTPAIPQGPTLEVYGVYDPQTENTPARPDAGAPATVNGIVGRVSAPTGVSTVTVNGRDVTVDEYGAFRIDIVPEYPSRPIQIIATDHRGQKANVEFYASLNHFEGEMVTYAQQSLN